MLHCPDKKWLLKKVQITTTQWIYEVLKISLLKLTRNWVLILERKALYCEERLKKALNYYYQIFLVKVVKNMKFISDKFPSLGKTCNAYLPHHDGNKDLADVWQIPMRVLFVFRTINPLPPPPLTLPHKATRDYRENVFSLSDLWFT